MLWRRHEIFGPRRPAGFAHHSLLVVLIALCTAFPQAEGASKAATSRARTPRLSTPPPAGVRPRSFTPQELSTRGLLGPFSNRDPATLGLVWQAGRDPRTCQDAWTLAKVKGNGASQLTAFLKRIESDPALATPLVFMNPERAIARALERSNRFTEADQFLRARLTVKIRDPDGKSAVERREMLWRRIAELNTPTRPLEAERILQGLVAERTTLAAKTFSEFRPYRNNKRVWDYGKAWYDFRVLAARFTMLLPFYESVGRLDEAAAIARELQAHLASRTTLMTSAGEGYSQLNAGDTLRQTIARLDAQIALRDGRSDAEQRLRDCCEASPQLIRFLLGAGKREDARLALSQRMIAVSDEVEQLFFCMRSPSPDPVEQAIIKARKEGEEEAVGSGAYRFSNEVAEKQVRLLSDTAEVLAHSVELAELLNDGGLIDDARNVLKPTIALAGLALGQNHPVTLGAMAAYAHQQSLRGASLSAANMWAQWLANSSEFVRGELWRTSEDDRRRFFRDDRRNVDLYLVALRDAKPPDAGTRALDLTLRHKGLLASVAGEISARARSSGDRRATSPLVQLAELRSRFAALALYDRGNTPDATLLRRQMSEIEAQLASSLQGGQQAPAPTSEAVRSALKPGEALIDFLVFKDADAADRPGIARMGAVVARPDSPPSIVWWDDVAPVRAAVARYRAAVQSESADRERTLTAAAHALYALVWKLLLPALGDAGTVWVAPDDMLNLVPLAAMIDDAGRPLVERYAIAMLSAPRDLLAQRPTRQGGAAVVLGNPAFGGSPVGGETRGAGRTIGAQVGQLSFLPLPGTLAEGRAVSALLPGSRLLSGNAATKAAVVSVRSPSVLHLATHGFFLSGSVSAAADGDPLISLSRSGLAFADANRGIQALAPADPGQGILTALEATSLGLRDTKLVVLSACETGLGQVASGEGVYGLAQALHEAGAQSVMATLWPVSDEATVSFMQQFYQRLAAGDQPQAALRSVQRSFAGGDEWRDPVFWAPFILTGR